jgi:glycine oxidase
MSNMRSYDAVVAGGGIIGAAIAFRLAQEKLHVALLDAQEPGREASWAAAGMLSPAPDSPEAIPLVPFGRASLALYPAFITELQEITGRQIGFRREGTIEVLFSPGAERELSTLVALHRGLGLATEPLALEEARKMEPGLGREARAAAFLPEEASVDNRDLTAAVLAAAAASGVEMLTNTQAAGVLSEGRRCTGIAVEGGETILAGNVILAAGAFCGAIKGLLPPVVTRPVRGQMVCLSSGTVKPRRVLRSDRGYIVPRDDATPQRLVAGSTLEDAGFEKCVTPQGLEKIFSAVQELVPGLASAAVVETWSGLRPDTPDHLPLLGPGSLEGLVFATGHYRNGILLAPITAKLVREWVTERHPSLNWERFSPMRFAGTRLQTSDPPADDRGSFSAKNHA